MPYIILDAAPPENPLRRIELTVESSGVPYTTLRPVAFMQNFSDGLRWRESFAEGIRERDEVVGPGGSGIVSYARRRRWRCWLAAAPSASSEVQLSAPNTSMQPRGSPGFVIAATLETGTLTGRPGRHNLLKRVWRLAVRVRTGLAFSAIFIVWGSTYLAIKYAVAEMPPLLTAGVRHLTAGSIMLLWAYSKGQRASIVEWGHSAVVGALFFLVGHGTLHWAERFVPSGVAALLIATEPVWIALLLAMTGQARLRPRRLGGLLLGLIGVWVVVGGDPASGTSPLGTITVLVGAIAWSAGVVYSQRAPLPPDATMRTATTLLTGAALTLGVSAVAGEFGQIRMPSLLAIASLAYLIVFGSILAFTAYFWLLERYSATLVATHTFVNPAVAVVLGWAIGGEAMSASLIGGFVLIAASIALVREGEPSGEKKRSAAPAIAGSDRGRSGV